MSLIVCPPPSAPTLDPDGPIPHPGFGYTLLERNGREVWFDIHGDGFDDATVADLTAWTPVRQGVGWKLTVYGPMVIEEYRLRRGKWTLSQRRNGFA